MATQESRALAERIVELVNAGDIDGLVALATDDFVVHTPIPGIGTGPEGFRTLMHTYFTAFPVQRVEINDIVAEDDRAVLRHTHHLTHGGEFAGLSPTGKQAVVEGLEIYRFVDGRVAEMWHADDIMGLMQQLGAIPAPEAVAV